MQVTLPFDPDFALSKKKLVCACTPDEENTGSDTCKIRKLGSTLEESALAGWKVLFFIITVLIRLCGL